MGSMKYAVIQNTVPDLALCLEKLESGAELSEEEGKASKRLVKLCRQIVAWADEQLAQKGD